MLEQVRFRARRLRTRLMMRSALRDGWLFRWMKGSVRQRFNDRAGEWDDMVNDHEYKWFDPLDAALDQLPADWSPARIADIGGGTGRAGYHLARRYPGTAVTVLDLVPNMLAFGRNRRTTESLPDVSFVAGDSAAIPLITDSLDLACILNAPLIPSEMARILRPGGVLVLAFTYGHHTPMYLDEATSRNALQRAGFVDIESGARGEGSWVMGRLPG